MWKRLLCMSNQSQREQHLPTRFSILVRNRRFEELSDLLATNNCDVDVPLPLHYILQYQPAPLSIVNQLISHYTKPEYTDQYGRNALHLACYHNAPVTIIARLMNHDATNLNIPDIMQSRYPLHWLCVEYDTSLSESALFVRDVLPSATLHKDIYGMTPADILKHEQALPKQSPLPAVPESAPQLPTMQSKADVKNRTLHIPIGLKETISDLTNATIFTKHSKSTCSMDGDEDEEQMFIVQAVRSQLLAQKQQTPERQQPNRQIVDVDWESVRC